MSLVGLIFVSVLGFGDPAEPALRAGDPQTEAPTMAVDRVVVVIAPRDDDLDERAAQAIKAHARALEGQVALVAGDGPAPEPTSIRAVSGPHFRDPNVRGVVWIDVATDGATELVLVPANDTRVYGSVVELGERSPALALEGLGNVVSSASTALLGGHSIAGMSTVLVDERDDEPAGDESDAEAPVPSIVREADPVRAPAQAWTRLTAGAGYAGNSYAPGQVWQHGAALRLGWQPTPTTWVAVGYDVVGAAIFDDARVRLSVRRHPITARAGYGWRVAKRWSIPLGGRLVVDPTTIDTETVNPSFEDSGRSTQVQVGLGALTGATFEASRWLRIRLDVGADAMLGRNSYVVLAPERQTVVRPDPVRFVVGLSMDFTGVRR